MEETTGSGAAVTGAKKRSRSGTEQRRKSLIKLFRVSPEEDAELTAAAKRADVSFGTYARARLLTQVETRGRSKRSDLKAEIIRLQGYVNRVGGNLHQIVKRINYGELKDGSEAAALLRPMIDDYEEVVKAILQTLGRGAA